MVTTLKPGSDSDGPKISFEDIMASLDKDTLSKVKIGSQISRESMPTASFKLNQILGGGFRKGKQHTLWGGEQSAKTSFMLQTVGINQKLGHNIAWIDAEHSFDPVWAARLGVDSDKILVSEVSTISELTDLQVKFINQKFDMIVIDSTSALMPNSYIDAGGELKAFGDTGQIGQMSVDLGRMCKMVQGVNYTCAIVHISQERTNIGSPAMHKPMKPSGGKETGHTDSLRVRMSGDRQDAKAIMAEVQQGSNLVEKRIGYPIKWEINKNKINGEYGKGVYDFYTNSNPDFSGLDSAGELLDEAVSAGIVERGGAWYTIFGERRQGRHNAVAYVRENEPIFEKIKVELSDESI